jgi:hypothetical protein
MMGMPIPQVDPSPSRIRTCTGFPDGVEGAADGVVEGAAEAACPACQASPCEDPPQAARSTSGTPSTAVVTADRHNRERLMPARVLRKSNIRQAATPAHRTPRAIGVG